MPNEQRQIENSLEQQKQDRENHQRSKEKFRQEEEVLTNKKMAGPNRPSI